MKMKPQHKPLGRLNRGNRERIQISKIRKEKGDIIMETVEIKKKNLIQLQRPIINKTEKSG